MPQGGGDEPGTAPPGSGSDPAGAAADPVNWLDAPEQQAWRAYLRGSRMLEYALDRDLQAYGMQLSEYEILSMLSEHPDGRMRMSALAELVVQSRSRLTHTAARLETRGWVAREASTTDRRGVELVLTDEGASHLQQTAPLHVASVRRRLLDHLSEDQFAALGEAMSAIVRGLRASTPDTSGADCAADVD